MPTSAAGIRTNQGRGGTRPSSASRQVAVIDAFHRAAPPEEYALTYDEEQEWWAVVNRMPTEWFPRETLPMLAQYCRHGVRANHIAKLVNEMMHQPNIDINHYRTLLDMEENQTRAIAILATRMRLSQQAIHQRRKQKGKVITQRPWDDDE